VLLIHRALLTAVASGNPDLAEEEMIRHLDESHHKVGKARH
jgi:DNA-binding FadR family transcriptional regulator